MTKKQYKYKQRCKIERFSKFCTWVVVCLTLVLGDDFGLSGITIGLISTTVWFIMPDISAFILEVIYKVEHKHDTYR